MLVARGLVAALLGLLPLGAAVWFVRRVRLHREVSWQIAVALGALGVAAGTGSVLAERALLRFTELSIDATPTSVATSAGAIAALFFLIAPLEEAAKVVAVWPAVILRRLDGPGLGVTFAVCVAGGFAAAETVLFVSHGSLDAVGVVRAAAGIPAHFFCAGLWGYALGRRVRRGGRWFAPAWVFAVALHALYDHIVFGRGPGLLVVALPMLVAMGLVTWSALRDIAPSASGVPSSLPLHLPEPPSLRAVRSALRRSDRPIAVRWIVGGALVNVGAVIVSIGIAVVLAKRFGVDLSVGDEADVRSSGPLVLVGTAVLSAFPVAGFLVARASSAHTVLEPAFAAGLAIALAVAWLSVTAPAAVIFAFAIAPIAFGLACGGAWFGLEA